ncbi:MAG: hypothetical protein ACFCU8_15360 [Thermosynechococcaceae cyanobacterium]
MPSPYLARPLLTTNLNIEVNVLDLWVPIALLGLIIAAALYFSKQ